MATVVEKGMERSTIYGSVGASLGAQVGFGPEYKQTYFFGRRGHRAGEIVPTLTFKQGLSLLVAGWEIPGGEQRFGSRSFEPSVGVKFLGVDVAVLPPFAKRATKSAYLKRLEAGQRLSKQAVQHLSDGQYTQARNVIDRLKIIYKKNVKERQMINGYKSEHMKDRNY